MNSEREKGGRGSWRWTEEGGGAVEIITFIWWFGGEEARAPPQLHVYGKRSAAPLPHYALLCPNSTLIDKAAQWRGTSCWQDLRRLFTEELVWCRPCSPCMRNSGGSPALMSLSFCFSLSLSLFFLQFQETQQVSIFLVKSARWLRCIRYRFYSVYIGFRKEWNSVRI